MKIKLAALVVFVCGTISAHAAFSVWDGGGANNLWSNPTNWNPNVAPAAGDDLVFPPGAAQATSTTNNFPSGTAFNAIFISSNTYALVGNPIVISNGVHVESFTSLINFGIPLTLAKAQTFTNNGTGRVQFNAPVDNAGFDLTLQINSGTNLFQSLSGISGAGGLIKNGNGLLRFTGITSNSFTGTTFVNAGTVELAKNSPVTSIPGPLVIGDGIGGPGADVVNITGGSQIADTSHVTINSSGRLNIGVFDVIGGLSGDGQVTLSGNHLMVNLASGTNLFSGTITGSVGLGFTKLGAGTMILTGTNAYVGTTTINGGTMQIDGFQPDSSVFLGGGTRLQGSGVVGSIDVNGNSSVISPGPGTAILTCSNFNSDAFGTGSLEIELNGLAPGSGHDQILASGVINFTGIQLNLSLNFPSALSNQFVIVNNTGTNPIAGTFSGRAEGATVTTVTESFRISYVGGDGNDVVLTQITETPPTLFIARESANTVRLSWATNFPGFALQANTNLNTTNWNAVAPGPTIVGAEYVVTNMIGAAETYFRLRKN